MEGTGRFIELSEEDMEVKVDTNRLGLAGELRVMSELLLRGYDPAKSYLEEGADILLTNGISIEVKTSYRHKATKRNPNGVYHFSFVGRRKNRKQKLCNTNIVICWCVDDDVFYIIPSKKITAQGIAFVKHDGRCWHQYLKYKEAWNLLE